MSFQVIALFSGLFLALFIPLPGRAQIAGNKTNKSIFTDNGMSKNGITSDDYKNDTLSQFWDYYWEKCDKKDPNAHYYSTAYPLNGKWVCEDYDLFEKKIINYLTYSNQNLNNLDGPFFVFNTSGSLRASGQYQAGKKNGPFLWYYPDGHLRDSTFYHDDHVIGTAVSFYSSGKLKEIKELDSIGSGKLTGYFENGAVSKHGTYSLYMLRDSVWTYYYPDGKVSFREKYNNDNRVELTCFNEDGTPKDSCITEEMPEFSGDLSKFLAKNIKWPYNIHFANVSSARAIVNFVIDIDGSISEIKFLKHIAKPFDDEIIRVIKKMPRWKPGLAYGNPIRVYYTLPVSFRQ